MHFRGFKGNSSAKELLSGCFDSGRVPHAFLIDGPQGSGKKTLAALIAAAIVCEGGGENPSAEKPCGECRQCKNALGSGHSDILVYSGKGGARSFSVDTVREIRLAAYIAPNDAEKKVFILTDIQDMTEAAQNALLKILEEPPAYTVFVLTCEGKARVLPTVLSRAQLITLGPVNEAEALEALLEQTPGADETAAKEAARLSGGIIGRAKELLQSGGAVRTSELMNDFSKALCGSSNYEFLRLSGRLETDSSLLKEFIALLPSFFRDAALFKTMGAGRSFPLLSGCEKEASLLASTFSAAKITAMLDITLRAREAADRYANAALLTTWLFSRLWSTAHGRV